MKIAVIIPSRLQANPQAIVPGRTYLDRAIKSVLAQSVVAEHEIEIVVGLDHGTFVGHRLPEATYAPSCGAGQALAVNAAARVALSHGPDLIAFLEDDDSWHPQKLDYQLQALAQGYDFISSSQREVTPAGDYVRVNDFPTMSGWVMPAQIWRDIGPMDETFKWHLDTEWIGRLNASGKKRLHFAEAGAVQQRLHFHDRPGGPPGNQMVSEMTRPWLEHVARRSAIAMTDGLLEPLVTRTVNPAGGMARIAVDPVEAARSQEEHMRFLAQWGEIPW